MSVPSDVERTKITLVLMPTTVCFEFVFCSIHIILICNYCFWVLNYFLFINKKYKRYSKVQNDVVIKKKHFKIPKKVKNMLSEYISLVKKTELFVNTLFDVE